jgi:hypothetical protein
LGFCDTPDCHVVGFGSTPQEDNFGGFCVNQARHLLAGLVDERLRLLPKPMNGRRIAEIFTKGWEHCSRHLRSHGCGRVTVEVDASHKRGGTVSATPTWNLVETHHPNQ